MCLCVTSCQCWVKGTFWFITAWLFWASFLSDMTDDDMIRTINIYHALLCIRVDIKGRVSVLVCFATVQICSLKSFGAFAVWSGSPGFQLKPLWTSDFLCDFGAAMSPCSQISANHWVTISLLLRGMMTKTANANLCNTKYLNKKVQNTERRDEGQTKTDRLNKSLTWKYRGVNTYNAEYTSIHHYNRSFTPFHPVCLSPPPLFIHSLISPSQSISPSPLTNALFHVLSYFSLPLCRPPSLTLMSHGPFVGPLHFWG